MPVNIKPLGGGRFQVRTPNMIHAKSTSLANAKSQERLINAVDHGWKPGIKKRAEGGNVKEGEPYLVGEEGPEIIVPKQNGTVVPNDDLKRELELKEFMARQRTALKEQSELPQGSERSQKRLMFNRGEELNEAIRLKRLGGTR